MITEKAITRVLKVEISDKGKTCLLKLETLSLEQERVKPAESPKAMKLETVQLLELWVGTKFETQRLWDPNGQLVKVQHFYSNRLGHEDLEKAIALKNKKEEWCR